MVGGERGDGEGSKTRKRGQRRARQERTSDRAKRSRGRSLGTRAFRRLAGRFPGWTKCPQNTRNRSSPTSVRSRQTLQLGRWWHPSPPSRRLGWVRIPQRRRVPLGSRQRATKTTESSVHRCWGGENFVHPSFIRNVPLPQRGSLAVAALKVCKPTANSRTALRPASSQRSWLPEPWNETSTTTVLAGVVSPLGPPSPPTAYTSQRTTSVVRVVSLGGCR